MNQPTTPTIPFAMRCTQEQFDDVKEELEKYQRIYSIFDFTRYPVLLLDNAWVTNTGEWYCRDTHTHLHHWDKSLFLKMAGKPDPESRELIGYKINPKMDITNEQLGKLLDCEIFEYNGFIWSGGKSWISPIPAYIRAVELNIVGEDKILVPVYATENYEIIDLKPLPQSEVDRIKEATFIRGTPEWQKSVREIDVTKEPVSEQLIRTLNDDEVLSLTQNCKLNISDYVKYLSFKKGRFWNNNTDTTNMKPTQCGGRITGTYEQQKGGER